MPKWKVFIVFHQLIYDDIYGGDGLFGKENYTFLKVGEQNCPVNYEYIDIRYFSNYTPLGKYYAESEAIYNVYKNPELWQDLSHIGFSQYDKPHKLKNQEKYNITELIINNLSPQNHISFETYTMQTDFNQHIMMDEDRPNELTGNGKNCYYGIIHDYNEFHGTVFCLGDIIKKNINLCSSFLLPVKNFDNIMKFISHIIESKKLDQFDTFHQHRIQGGLLERYIGVAIILENLNLIDLTTEHYNLK